MEKPENITIFGARIRGAKAAILRLQEESFFDCHEKEQRIINKAVVDYCLSDNSAMDEFLSGKEFRLRNHKVDKKGNLVNVKAYLPNEKK